MDWETVSSTEFHAIKYDDKALVLEIHFRNGRVYRYTGVPDSVYKALLGAESKGRFFNALIRNKYPFQRLV